MIPSRLACALVGLTMIGACTEDPAGSAEPASPRTGSAASAVSYACESGRSVAVSYPDEAAALLVWQDRNHELRLDPTPSGARYVGSGLEWRTTPGQGQETAELRRLRPGEVTGSAVLERCSRPTPAVLAAEPSIAAQGAVAAIPPPCRGAQLRLSAEGGDAGAGNRVAVFGLQNTGERPCSLNGHAGVVLEDASGQALEGVRSEPVLGGYFSGDVRPAPVELEPRERAFFDIAWSAIPNEGRGEQVCPKAARLRVTAPGDASPVALAQALQPCGGRIRISPFRPVADSVPPAGPAAV